MNARNGCAARRSVGTAIKRAPTPSCRAFATAKPVRKPVNEPGPRGQATICVSCTGNPARFTTTSSARTSCCCMQQCAPSMLTTAVPCAPSAATLRACATVLMASIFIHPALFAFLQDRKHSALRYGNLSVTICEHTQRDGNSVLRQF